MATDYVISSPDRDADSPHSSEWPKELRLSFEDEEISLLQDKGHRLGGAFYDFEEFRVAEWTESIEAGAGEWLLAELSSYESLTAIEETGFVRRFIKKMCQKYSERRMTRLRRQRQPHIDSPLTLEEK
ncbi:hypothetical protein Halru_2161 [Halovivax ruber XH-70]|uniref:Uncharacterized protein n=1 Tax=Halovivax ruber (strain DSM 18193 / JCM 13892 / XH-70) TaxID=797302 RepID=L0IDA4_HALRX|nr:hypothetical protein [Halovivax ruber]AGB16749.1 hypothetical protein Halru_2161 [Halovivax ruber XH-70]